MGNTYTGSNSGKAGLNVKKTDNTVDVFGVNQIQLDSNLTLTDNGNGSVTIQSSGGGGGGGGTVTSVQVSGGTDGGILLGSGTGAITATSQPTNGQLLIGSSGTDPALATLTSTGGSITITNGAGTINLETAVAGYSGWVIEGGNGLTDTVNSGDTLDIVGGTGITTTLSGQGTATPTLTIDVDGTSPTGTGAANQVALWSGANTLTGNAGLTFTETTVGPNTVQTLLVSGSEPRIQTQDTTSAVGSRATITLDPSVPDGTGGVGMFWGTDADLELYMKLGAFAGANNIETKSRDFRFFGATGNLLTMDESALNTAVGGIFGLNNGSDPLPLPTRTLDVGKEDSSTNTVLNILGLTRQTSGASPAVGIGVGMDFVVETTNNNNEIGATIEAVTTNVGATTEAFDFTFKLMAGGATAAEKMRIASTGAITFNQAYTFPTADGNAGDVLQTDGGGNLSFAAAGGGGTPAGSNTEIQFNNSGAFGASSDFTYNDTSSPKLLTIGSVLGNGVALTQFTGASSGGAIVSNETTFSADVFGAVSALSEVGIEQTTTDHQVKTGKTTTQSFGQTQKTISGAGTYDCYPSEGGLIVVDGSAAAIVLNLTLAQDSGIGAFDPIAKGTAPNPTLNGYGTWQIGDQVTVMAGLNLGQTPNITISSYNSETNGVDGTITGSPDPSRPTDINGVDSTVTPITITTNYTAKTFVLRQDLSGGLGVSWVCIG